MTRTRRPDDDEAVRTLDEEIERAVGEPVADEIAREALERPGPGPLAGLGESKLLVGILLAAAVVVGTIVALATGSWWALGLAVAVHAVVTFVVIRGVMRMTSEVERPDSATVGRLEAAGVADPEAKLNAAIRAASGRPAGRPEGQVLADDVGDQTAPGHGGLERTARQQLAGTPSSEPTRPVGPGGS